MAEHKTTALYHNGQTIHIDDDMVEIINLCWSLGIETTSCCQSCRDLDRLDMVWIQFQHSAFLKFMEIITAVDYTKPAHEIEYDLLFHKVVMEYSDNSKDFVINCNMINTVSYRIDWPQDFIGEKKNVELAFNCNFFYNPKYHMEITRRLRQSL